MITTDMISSYEGLENNEMVAELGIKTIKDIEKERNYTKMLQKSTLFLLSYLKLYSRVAKALMTLKRLDEGNHYIGECIEVHFLALSYNPQPETFEKHNKVLSFWYGESRFVLCFKDLVQCQIENKCCMEALKSFKRFKIHSLNSKNPEDVKIHFMKIVAEYHEFVSVHTEGDLSIPEKRKIQEKIDNLLRIADLCQMKCELFRSLNEIETYCLWTHYTIWFLYESYGESLKFRKDIPHAKLTLLKLC
jgi:hypothetical protein